MHTLYGELVAPRFSTAPPAEADRPFSTPRRGLSPRCATEADDKNERAGLSAVMMRAAARTSVTVSRSSSRSSQGPKQEGTAMIRHMTRVGSVVLLLIAALYPGAAVAHEGSGFGSRPLRALGR